MTADQRVTLACEYLAGARLRDIPRCKGRRRGQRLGSGTVHRLVFRIRDGQRTAAKYREDSHGDS